MTTAKVTLQAEGEGRYWMKVAIQTRSPSPHDDLPGQRGLTADYVVAELKALDERYTVRVTMNDAESEEMLLARYDDVMRRICEDC